MSCTDLTHKAVRKSVGVNKRYWCTECKDYRLEGLKPERKPGGTQDRLAQKAAGHPSKDEVTLVAKVRDPWLEFRAETRGLDLVCSHNPWLYDFSGLRDASLQERRRQAAEGCAVCPGLEACTRYAEAARRTLEPGCVMAGRYLYGQRERWSSPILKPEAVAS